MQSVRYHIFFLFSAFSLLMGCAGSGQQKEQKDLVALEKEVISIHDEVMPKMSDVARLIAELETQSQSNKLDSMLRKEIAQSITELNAGDSLMWEWMHNYSKPENAPTDSIHAYLQSEKERVSKVRNVMLESIKNAESLIQKLGHAQPN